MHRGASACVTHANDAVGEEAVSYTHLDVYKRQAMEGQTMTGLEPIAAVALTKAVDFLFDQAGKLMDCLLYTSRCV